MISKEQHEAAIAKNKREGFDSFMKQPMTRAMISMLPPNENLEVMLRAAFEHGYGSGCVHTTITLMSMIVKDPRG